MRLSHFSCSFVYRLGLKKKKMMVRSTKRSDWGTERRIGVRSTEDGVLARMSSESKVYRADGLPASHPNPKFTARMACAAPSDLRGPSAIYRSEIFGAEYIKNNKQQTYPTTLHFSALYTVSSIFYINRDTCSML
jgi:hypothetical protein